MIPAEPSRPEPPRVAPMRVAAAHAVTILAHLALVAGMVWIGLRHFDNIHTGAAAATLYLLTFSTSQLTSQVDHVVPAMLLLWAVAAYRRPLIAGFLLGLAAGLIYYPLFLLPLWFGFYWWRGAVRFGAGVALALALLVAVLAITSPQLGTFTEQVRLMFGWRNPFNVKPSGFWQYWREDYRVIPVLAAFVALSAGLAIWPRAQESRHALELLGGRDAGHPVLARRSGRPVRRLVSAAADPDHLPPEPRRPRRAFRRAAGLGKEEEGMRN